MIYGKSKLLKKERNSAFELLRIIAMFMVVLGHCMLATAKDVEPCLGTIDNIGWFIGAFTIPAVNVFFLLTGFFSTSNFRLRGGINVWIKTLFYSIAVYIIISIFLNQFNVKTLITYCFPVLLKKYWFIQVYMVLFFLMPYIVKGLEGISLKNFNYLLLILIVFCSLHETFIKVQYTLDTTQGYGIIWGCTMLVVGSWVRRIKDLFISRVPAWVFFVFYILISIAIFVSNYIIVKYNVAGGIESRGNFYAYNSFSVFIQSLVLFLGFVKISEKNINNKVINFIGKHTLSVYLISAHPLLLYPLWTDYFKIQRWHDAPHIYVSLAILLTCLIMLACVLIDTVVDFIINVITRRIKK